MSRSKGNKNYDYDFDKDYKSIRKKESKQTREIDKRNAKPITTEFRNEFRNNQKTRVLFRKRINCDNVGCKNFIQIEKYAYASLENGNELTKQEKEKLIQSEIKKNDWISRYKNGEIQYMCSGECLREHFRIRN